MKPLVVGRPREATPATEKTTTIIGICRARPPSFLKSLSPVLCITSPAMAKSKPVMTPWLNICRAAPVILTCPRAKTPKRT
ncbi:hypothetical protein ES703_100649 [subsurface metagenome]